MPFGKFKGHALSTLPDDYIAWLFELDDLRQPFATHLCQEYQRRFGRRQNSSLRNPSSTALVPAELRETASQIIEKGYRLLAKQCHPDVGGTHEQMLALNKTVATLKELAGC
jgi:hypothetical protein